MTNKRKQNFKFIEAENPKFAQILRVNLLLRDFNADYEEIHETDEITLATNLRNLSDQDLVFDRLSFL